MIKKVFQVNLVIAALVSIVLGIFTLLPEPLNELIYCVFISFAITYAVDADYKKTHNYILSEAIGFLWAYAYYFATAILLGFSLILPIAVLIGTFVVTFIIITIHLLLLTKTPFNSIPLAFAPVIGFFAVNGEGIGYVAIALVTGTLLAVSCQFLTGLILKPKQEISNVTK